MLQPVSKLIRIAAFNQSQAFYWAEKIRYEFGIKCLPKEINIPMDDRVLRQIYNILEPVPVALTRACGVKTLYLSYSMGRSLPYTPNHGYYINSSITLNVDIFYHPDDPEDFHDDNNYAISRAVQTFWHEEGHSYDQNNGINGVDLSAQESWMKLSGWSKIPKPGLRQLIITSPGNPPVIGESYFSPEAEFTRFYGKRNEYDDFADCFSFFVGGLRDKVPPLKRSYFDTLLKSYYLKTGQKFGKLG
jgi:hypothetical protein